MGIIEDAAKADKIIEWETERRRDEKTRKEFDLNKEIKKLIRKAKSEGYDQEAVKLGVCRVIYVEGYK